MWFSIIKSYYSLGNLVTIILNFRTLICKVNEPPSHSKYLFVMWSKLSSLLHSPHSFSFLCTLFSFSLVFWVLQPKVKIRVTAFLLTHFIWLPGTYTALKHLQDSSIPKSQLHFQEMMDFHNRFLNFHNRFLHNSIGNGSL